jgi:hypothetical protein
MQRASQLIDEAESTQDYHLRLVALGLLARQYLRELREPPLTNRSGFRLCQCGATLPCHVHATT